ncbi:MAG: CBS domain-containing protein [Woeseia sp.]
MSIDTIMTTNLVTISPTENLDTARTLMHDNRIHHLPVVNQDDELVGLVTLTNVLAATDSILRDPDNRMHASEISITDVMVTDVVTVDDRVSMRQAALFLDK